MNAESLTLGAVCTANMLETKWLLAPSHRTAHQWIETLVRNGQSIVNLRPTTVVRLALELIGPDLAKNGLSFVSGDVGSLIVDASWRRLPLNGYLGQLRPSNDLSNAIYESLISVRLTGARESKFGESHLEKGAKTNDSLTLLNAYKQISK